MPNYQNTIIYKIICLDTDVKEFYVGHTTNKKRREKDHKDCCSPNHCKSKMGAKININCIWFRIINLCKKRR
jgi:predicted GIY-YIG superfamily endonuclease